jgi:hypothetical protein
MPIWGLAFPDNVAAKAIRQAHDKQLLPVTPKPLGEGGHFFIPTII